MNILSKLSTVATTLRGNGPTIALVGGIVSGVGAAVLLAKAHKKSDEILGPIVEEINDIKVLAESGPQTTQEKYDTYHAVGQLSVDLVVEAAKLYGPAIVLGGVSIGLLLAGHKVQMQRLSGLAAGLTLVQEGFQKYRERVREEFGEEADERFLMGSVYRNVKTTSKTEDGRTVRTSSSRNEHPAELNPIVFQRVFDPSNRAFWQDGDPATNLFFLRSVESQLTDKLMLRGHVVLNDVYTALGFDHTSYGAVVGWSLKANPDSHIDLGLEAVANENATEAWLICPNVDGVVWDLIGGRR